MSTYDALASTIEDIIEAAIEWAMLDSHWTPSGDGFRFVQLGWTVPGPAAGPGAWPIEFEEPRSRATITYNFWEDVYQPWREAVEGLFEPWMPGNLGDPAEFAGSITAAFQAAEKLSSGEDAGDAVVPANPELGDLTTASDRLTGMRGQTIRTFKRLYMDRLPLVLATHCGAAATLTECLLAEQKIWVEAERSVASTADAMLAAMRARGDDGGAKAALTVLGAVAGVVGLFATGGWAIAAGAVGIGTTLISEGLNEDGEKKSVGGGSASEVHDAAKAALETLAEHISTEETAVADRAGDLTSGMTGPAWQLDLPPDTLVADGEEDFTGEGEMLAVQGEDLVEIGDVLLPNIASQLKASAALLNGDVRSFTPWSRSSGIGHYSGYYATSTLADSLADLLVDNGRELTDAGDHLVVAAGYIGDQDDQVDQQLRQHTQEIEDARAAELEQQRRLQNPRPGDPMPV